MLAPANHHAPMAGAVTLAALADTLFLFYERALP